MSENGMLNFQRSLRRHEKVRDYSSSPYSQLGNLQHGEAAWEHCVLKGFLQQEAGEDSYAGALCLLQWTPGRPGGAGDEIADAPMAECDKTYMENWIRECMEDQESMTKAMLSFVFQYVFFLISFAIYICFWRDYNQFNNVTNCLSWVVNNKDRRV